MAIIRQRLRSWNTSKRVTAGRKVAYRSLSSRRDPSRTVGARDCRSSHRSPSERRRSARSFGAVLSFPGTTGHMRLHDDEPWMEEGEVVALTDVVDRLASTARSHTGPFLIALDGRSASGKTTLAARLASVTPGTVVVHTDDIAWCHSRFGWDDLLIDGIIEPLRRGEMVDYRPPAWDARGREGSTTVPAHASVVVIEGVGAGRATIGHAVDAVIWPNRTLTKPRPGIATEWPQARSTNSGTRAGWPRRSPSKPNSEPGSEPTPLSQGHRPLRTTRLRSSSCLAHSLRTPDAMRLIDLIVRRGSTIGHNRVLQRAFGAHRSSLGV